MVTERKGRVRLVTKTAIGVNGPAGQHRDARPSQIPQHGGPGDIGWAEQDFEAGGSRIVLLVRRKALAELLVDFGQPVNGAVQHDRQSRVAEAAQKLLAFAERIAEEDGGFLV